MSRICESPRRAEKAEITDDCCIVGEGNEFVSIRAVGTWSISCVRRGPQSALIDETSDVNYHASLRAAEIASLRFLARMKRMGSGDSHDEKKPTD